MRRRSVVAIAALIVAFALAGLPAPAGSTPPSMVREPAPGAFSSVIVPAMTAAPDPGAAAEDVGASAGRVETTTAFSEPGEAPAMPTSRPHVTQPVAAAGEGWKAASQVLHGEATFYDHGTTAMRLPRGTIVRICGAGGCIERVVNDYGPQKPSRIVDLYRPDFFAICGCGSWSGVTDVTVHVY
jgi:hypothetical protein